MSLDPRAWRPSPLLPPARGAGLAALCLGAALISLVAVLAMAWLSADVRARPVLRARLGGGATVAVTTSRTRAELESLDAAAWRAREILAMSPGVASAHVLAPAPGDQAIAAALGMGAAPARLIAVSLAPPAREANIATTRALINALSREGLVGAADDHNPVTGPVERVVTLDALGLAVAGALLMGILAGLAAAMILERARRVAPRITLLSGLGMSNGALLTRLLRPVVLSASLAAIAGAAVAMAILVFADPRLPGLAPLIPAPSAVDLLSAAIWPALAVLVVLAVAMVIGLGRMKVLAP